MPPSLIKINYDSADRISELHGINVKLAERIIKYRTSHGYFHTPEDLDKVKGIGLNLAEALAPHIDWSVPQEPPADKQREWVGAVIILAVGFLLFRLSWQRVGEVARDVAEYRGGWDWLGLWMDASIAASQGLGVTLTVLLALHSASKRHTAGTRISSAIKATLWALLGAILSLGASNFIYYQFAFPAGDGWRLLFSYNRPGLLAVVGGCAIFLMFGPAILRPVHLKISSSPHLKRLHNAALFLTGLLNIGIFLFAREQLSFFFQIGGIITSLAFMGIALTSLLTGKSFHDAFAHLFLPKQDRAGMRESDEWLKWLNIRLPDINEQKELKKALDEAYPPSKIRTVTSVIFITVCGWIILQSIGAAIQWAVQKWLENLHMFSGL